MQSESEGKWVMVVDDNDGVREALSRIMALLGFEVAQASNGMEALALFSQRGFELILTDLHMPGMDGLNLASRIKCESPATPVVLVTGSMKGSVEKRMEDRPVDAVVYKPFRVEELLDAVRSFTGVESSL